MEKDEFSQDEKTMVAHTPSGDETLLAASVRCPVCGTENVPTEKYCGDCGFLLSSTPGEPVSPEATSAQVKLVDTIGQREFLLRPGQNTVGREGADVLLGDPTVSRKHAVITLEDSKCFIEDLGSTNGTYVDGVLIPKGEKQQLRDGAEVKFGNTVLVLQLPPVPCEAEESPTAEPAARDAGDQQATSTEEKPEEIALEQEETKSVARLVLVSDPSTVFDVKPGTNRLGRRSESDIPLTFDGYVSGTHCDILAEDGEFYVVDLGSTNGTFINGEKIPVGERVRIEDGSELTVGQTVLRFEVLTEEASSEEIE